MTLTTRDKKQIERIQKGLHCSYDEALQVFNDDKAVEKGEAMPFDLDKEKQSNVKKMLAVGQKTNKIDEQGKPTAYNFNKRERKQNLTKANLIEEIAKALQSQVDNLQIVNKERLISFEYEENNFEITLTQKRKRKEGKKDD